MGVTRDLQLSPHWCLLERKLGLELWPTSIKLFQRALQQACSFAHLQGLMAVLGRPFDLFDPFFF